MCVYHMCMYIYIYIYVYIHIHVYTHICVYVVDAIHGYIVFNHCIISIIIIINMITIDMV